MSEHLVPRGRVIDGGNLVRRPAGVVASICVLVALVGTGCGGRADKAKEAATTSIGPLTVMGTLVGLTDKGLAPVPGTPKTADLNSLTKQLNAAGITLGFLPGEETPTGIDSAALVVGIAQKGPGGITRVRIILGRVRAKVETNQA